MGTAAIGRIQDTEFAGLAISDPDENVIELQARAGLPLAIPWSRRPMRLGTSYHSSRQLSENPWAADTPFALSDDLSPAKVFRAENGSTSSFTSKQTSRAAESNDHLTLGIGIGVAPPIPIAKVSVKGEFDQQVQENSDSDKTSIRATCRAGCIEFESQPRLTTDAIARLKSRGGFDAFRARYGDYYVAGYRIGADVGMLLSTSSRKQVDKYSIKATLEVLFVEGSKTWSKTFDQFRSGRAMKLLGYDTLEGRNWKNASSTGDRQGEINSWLQGKAVAEGVGSLQSDANDIAERSQRLQERVMAVMQAQGVEMGVPVTFQQCDALAQAGLVVELQLQPMTGLREVLQLR